MKIHYKGRAWSEEIDPTFNEIIKQYLEGLRLIEIPANRGHLILTLPEATLKKIEREGYPKFGKFYEKADDEDIVETAKLLFADEMKGMDFKSIKNDAKKRGVLFPKYVRGLLYFASLIKRGNNCDYYLNSFKPLRSEENLSQFISGMTEKQRQEYRRKINSDILSMAWHLGMAFLDEIKKETEHVKALHFKILNNSKLIRRMMFSVWNNICLMNHKKTLRQLFHEARDDQDNISLFQLFQYDPTLFDHDWMRVRLRKALYSGNMKFFDDLADALKKGCLDTRKDNLDITIALVTFWKAGIYRLNSEQKMQLLRDSGIKFNMKENTFRQVVNRIRPFVDWPAIKN